jgi:cyclopropane-fatty-acyl-phospholipid synthase
VERYGSRATGCTLSPQQYDAAIRLIGERGLADRARIELRDYRDVEGRFTKIASVGMVEHVGRSRLRAYFRTLAARLTDDGLVLNHAIARPSTVRTDAASHFLQRRVFPGGELVSIGEMIAAAEYAGFEAIDVENLRPHYARTCRAWVDRLQANRDACERIVGPETYRTWLLYLAASSASFADGVTEVFQLLLAKRGTRRTLINRRYMYDTPPR